MIYLQYHSWREVATFVQSSIRRAALHVKVFSIVNFILENAQADVHEYNGSILMPGQILI